MVKEPASHEGNYGAISRASILEWQTTGEISRLILPTL